ncbi:hypothetical protein BJX65DRAFT_282679 [Aspergillus insuetus]
MPMTFSILVHHCKPLLNHKLRRKEKTPQSIRRKHQDQCPQMTSKMSTSTKTSRVAHSLWSIASPRPMSRLWFRRLSRRDTGDSLQGAYPGATNRVVDMAKSQISQVRPQLICPAAEPDYFLSSMKGAHDHSCRLIPSSGIPLVETPAMYIVSVHDIEEDDQRRHPTWCE